jgi:hypothetical protein
LHAPGVIRRERFFINWFENCNRLFIGSYDVDPAGSLFSESRLASFLETLFNSLTAGFDLLITRKSSEEFKGWL